MSRLSRRAGCVPHPFVPGHSFGGVSAREPNQGDAIADAEANDAARLSILDGPAERLASGLLLLLGVTVGGVALVELTADDLETHKLEQLEARMDEIADWVARDRLQAARDRKNTDEDARLSN
jgi:hypothetical protein